MNGRENALEVLTKTLRQNKYIEAVGRRHFLGTEYYASYVAESFIDSIEEITGRSLISYEIVSSVLLQEEITINDIIYRTYSLEFLIASQKASVRISFFDGYKYADPPVLYLFTGMNDTDGSKMDGY